MFPHIDEQVLLDNPGFAKLISTLQNEILNSDGSTRVGPSAKEEKERETVQQGRKELEKYRRLHAKQGLLERAIATISIPDNQTAGGKPAKNNTIPGSFRDTVPESLADLLLVLPSLVDGEQPISLDDAIAVLSSPPFNEFEDLVPELASLVSANIHASALSVSRIAHPSTNASHLHRHIPTLPADHAALVAEVSEAQRDLLMKRLKTLACLCEVLSKYTESLARLIESLEAKHGEGARSLELRASDVWVQARRTELDVNKTSQMINKDMYSAEAVSALQNYLAHLKDARIRATERIRGLQAELAEYGVGVGDDSKEKTMREISRVYREIESQMEDLKGDIDRLGAQ